MLGITPVIAHIERYDALENNEKRGESDSIWDVILRLIVLMS